MKRLSVIAALIALLCLGSLAQAITIDTVPVGDVGNQADTRYETPGYGSVGYNYNIGKYEVTAAQYTDFLNKVAKTDTYGLYNTNMSRTDYGSGITRIGSSGSYTYSVVSDWANRPVNCVSWYDTLRFANWLTNGQGSGSTETGSYTITGGGVNSGTVSIPTHEPGTTAKWFLTSQDEWYKAAYYKGGGANAGYWDYPMQSDVSTTPSNDITDPDGGNNANFYQSGYTIGSPYYQTNVGEFENSDSPYGTFDQAAASVSGTKP